MKRNILPVLIAILFTLTTLYSCKGQKYDFSYAVAEDGNGSGSFKGGMTKKGSYRKGKRITVKAEAAEGSFFFGWYDAPVDGNIVSYEESYSFKLEKDSVLYARFELDDIKIGDKGLEKRLRLWLDKPEGRLTYSDVSGIKNLELTGDDDDMIEEISGLEYFTGLIFISFSRTKVVDFSPIENLVGLQYLYIYDNEVSDLSFLKNLSQLENLLLFNSGLDDLRGVERLTGLKKLSLDSNGISDISILGELTGLEVLNLSNNSITDISALADMTELTTLELEGNDITNLSPLQNMSSLKNLWLSFNKIDDITPLAGFDKLEALALHYNEIEDISALKKLSRLETVFLSENRIIDITPLVGLPELKEVYVYNNRITDITSLLAANWVDRKFSITLGGNPIPEEQVEVLRGKLGRDKVEF